ncbi:hypothetical protein BGZ83_009341 [Gryganskiella cystojenkinii]|nr:hypothetical protein BGZ83_009341 [Gryganskiella cystojenkinii]
MAFDIRDDDEEHHPDEFEEYDDVKQAAPPKFYRRRKFWMFCIPNLIIATIVAVLLGLYVIMPKIAQDLMNKSTIEFSQIDITNPSATNMDIIMVGEMKNTGPFAAEISFPGEVTVSWNGTVLGTTQIPGSSKASGGHGNLNLASSFTVTNTAGFTEFSSYMLNSDSFIWHLEGKLNVHALGRTVKNLDLKKDIKISAFNGLNGIKIDKFSLPGDDPNGKGIIIQIDTTVNNPSSIQMYMGSLTLAISYKDVLMGYVTSTNLTMVRGLQTMSLTGVLIPQNTTEGLAVTSEMMSRYIGNVLTNTTATGVEVKPDGVNSVAWLSDAVKSLKLTVPLQSAVPLQLIKALNLGALGLVFTPPTAYEPVTTSTGVLANYSLPDGFNFKIAFQQVSNSFALTRGGVTIANLNSSYNPSTSDMAAGTLTFNLLATPLLVPDASHQSFQEFNRDLTIGADLPFNVIGQASVYANTSIGVVNLVNIPFNASTELSGLQSLANPAPTITSLQVVSGTTTGLTMNISVVIVNPSSISLSAGDVILALVYKGVNLGTVTMPNLSIVPGANTIATSSTIDPAQSPEGLELLNLYTSGAGATVNIAGTPTSTTVDSLNLAFGALNIQTQMPGLQSKLLAGASLLVLDTTLVNGLAQTVVTVNNPFVPAMTILSIDCKITYNGVAVGSVVSVFATPPVIPGVGQGTITASLAMNTDPHDLVTLIRSQAIKNGINTDAFDGLISLQSGGKPPASLFVGFNVADFTLKAMAGLQVDITMTTTVKVGDYQVTIPYTQTGVSTATDASLLKLIPLVGSPIAQVLVDGSALQFDSIKIISPTDTSFQTDIEGAISNTGPLDAKIDFPNPVTVSYEGKAIGSMMMPSVNAIANQGATLNLTGVAFTISDIAAYTDFTIFALNNAKFEWTIATTGVVVNAMGVPIPGVSMTKKVTLDGFNKLAGLVLNPGYIIEDVDAAGLHMLIGATINNPSTIGMTIPLSQFNTQFHGTLLGPAVAVGLTLVPHGRSDFSLNATISPGHGNMIPYLEGIFSNALKGVATPLQAQGVGAPGVSWLDTAIKSLTLDTSLPPLSAPPIDSIVIDAMTMDFTCDSCVWQPKAKSTITAKTNLPFAKGAPIVRLSQNVNILDDKGQLVGLLSTPYADATHNGSYVTSTSDTAPLVVADGSHEVYEKFVGALNNAVKYEVGLSGTANSILDLGVLGMVEVKGIALNVTTNLNGLQGLKDITITNFLGIAYVDPNSGSQIVPATYIVNIRNPSQLTLHIGDLIMNVGTDYLPGGFGGKATTFAVTLAPGDNFLYTTTFLDISTDGGWAIFMALGITYQEIMLYLYTGDDASSNPALTAGLKGLQVSVLAPLLSDPTKQGTAPFESTFQMEFLPTTLSDGLVQMSGTFKNPYYNLTMAVVHSNYNPSGSGGGYVYLTNPSTGYTFNYFYMLDNFSYTLAPGETKNITFNVHLANWTFNSDPQAAGLTRAKIVDLIAQSKLGPINMSFSMAPAIQLQNKPGLLSPAWNSVYYYPNMTIQPSNLDMLLQWSDKVVPPPTNTTTPNTTTTGAMPLTTSSSLTTLPTTTISTTTTTTSESAISPTTTASP